MSEPDPDFAAAARRASLGVALALSAATALACTLHRLAPLALVGPLALGLLVLRLRAWGGPSTLPNLITALRVILTATLAFASPVLDGTACAACILVVFVLDGLDGLLARRYGSASAQGAHFDMEADGYLVLVACTLNLAAGVGAWVLIGGLLRYAYAIAAAYLPRGGEAPRSRFGRYAFAASLSMFATALLFASPWSSVPAALGTAILLLSFGRSFAWLFACREPHGERG